MIKKVENYINLYHGCDVLIVGEEGLKKNMGLYHPDVFIEDGELPNA